MYVFSFSVCCLLFFSILFFILFFYYSYIAFSQLSAQCIQSEWVCFCWPRPTMGNDFCHFTKAAAARPTLLRFLRSSRVWARFLFSYFTLPSLPFLPTWRWRLRWLCYCGFFHTPSLATGWVMNSIGPPALKFLPWILSREVPAGFDCCCKK